MANRTRKPGLQDKLRQNRLQQAGDQAIRARKRPTPKVSEAPDAYAVPGAKRTVDSQGSNIFRRPGRTAVKFLTPSAATGKPSTGSVPKPASKSPLPPGTGFSDDGKGGTSIKPPKKRRRKRPMYGGAKKPLVVYED